MIGAGDERESREESGATAGKRPLYARLLRLKHITPGPWWCFLFLEGAIAVAVVLVLADWVSPWAVVVLPLAVAFAVKLNDAVAGALAATSRPEDGQPHPKDRAKHSSD